MFVFEKGSNGRFATTATTHITRYTGETRFGSAVALTDTHLAVGAPGPGTGKYWWSPICRTNLVVLLAWD